MKRICVFCGSSPGASACYMEGAERLGRAIVAKHCALVYGGSSVGLMAMSAYLISKAALVTEVADLSLAITGVRFFAIARAALRYAERYITHTATFRILTHLRVWFYEAIEPLVREPDEPASRDP